MFLKAGRILSQASFGLFPPKSFERGRTKEIGEEDIVFKTLESGTDMSMPDRLYYEMMRGGKNFWEAVHRPFLRRDLNRREVKEIIAMGLKETGGSFNRLLPLFNLKLDKKEYQRFMKVLRVHRLYPD